LLCGWLPVLLVQRRDKKMWRRVLGLELKPLIASVGRRTAGRRSASCFDWKEFRDGVGSFGAWLATLIWKQCKEE